MPKIFISYRRSASAGHAGRLYDRLTAAYGEANVFLDVEQIPVGETFSSYLLAKIDDCDIFLLMLGEGTLDRVVNEDDWVRREIAYALQHEGLTVIPVLQDGYKMPPPDTLPEEVRDITSKNAAFLFHQMFDESTAKIIENINALFSTDNTIDDEIPIQVVDTPAPMKQISSSPATGTGQLKIHRVSNFVAKIRAYTIKLDGQTVRQIKNDETVILDVAAGRHVLSVHFELHHPEIQLNIQDGETQSYEIYTKNMGFSMTIEQV